MVFGVLNVQGQKSQANQNTFDVEQTTFSAGADASICRGVEFVTQGYNNSPVMSFWQSSGDGVFENSNDLITLYTPGEQDMINGAVTLSLFLLPMGGSGSEVIVDDMILYIGNCTNTHQLK